MIDRHVDVGSSVVASLSSAATTVVGLALTATDVTTMTVSIAALIAALFTGIVNIITAVRTTRKVDEVAGKVAEVKEGVTLVAGHVNSAATASAAKIEQLQNELRLMRESMAEKEKIAAVLAQAASTPKPAGTTETPLPDPRPINIDKT